MHYSPCLFTAPQFSGTMPNVKDVGNEFSKTCYSPSDEMTLKGGPPISGNLKI